MNPSRDANKAADLVADKRRADLAALREQRKSNRPPQSALTPNDRELRPSDPLSTLARAGVVVANAPEDLSPAEPFAAPPDFPPLQDNEAELQAVEHPEDNPAWRPPGTARYNGAPKRALPYQKELVAEFVSQGRGDVNMLDDTIYQMRLSGMGAPDIAARLGSGVTVAFVEARLRDQLAKRNTLTAGEYRWLQLGRYEALINMMWGLAEAGSEKHIPLLLMALERLNKMYELEKETTRIEVEIISDGQAQTMKAACALILERFMSIPGVREAVDRAVLEEQVDAALNDAADIIDAPENRVLPAAS